LFKGVENVSPFIQSQTMSSGVRQLVLDYVDEHGSCELHDIVESLDFPQYDIEKALMVLWEQNAVKWEGPTIFTSKQEWDVEEEIGDITIRFDEVYTK